MSYNNNKKVEGLDVTLNDLAGYMQVLKNSWIWVRDLLKGKLRLGLLKLQRV